MVGIGGVLMTETRPASEGFMTPVAPRLRVVFFDVGGTLLRPHSSVGWQYASLARHYGGQGDAARLDRAFRNVWRERVATATPRPPQDRTFWREMVWQTWQRAGGLSKGFPFQDYFDELFDHFARPAAWRPFPEMDQALDRLRRAGLRAGILSNWDYRLRGLLEAFNWAGRFDPIVISGEVGWEKPDPRLFEHAAACAGVPAGACALVGDDVRSDGEGAARSGWHFAPIQRPERDLLSALDELGVPFFS